MEHHPVLCRRIAAALAWTHGTQRLDNQIYDRLIRWRAPPRSAHRDRGDGR
jgi:CHASE2 domain-containing sensor protein